MEWIDRYVFAVTQRLPERQRGEINRELRGLIEDMAEERIANGETPERAVEEALMELGDPAELAEKYRGRPRYVIAPELTDSYIAVLKVVGASIGIALGVVFAIRALLDPTNVLDAFVESIVTFVTAAAPQGFAWVTAIFIGLSFVGIDGKPKAGDLAKSKPWSLSQLPEVPDKRRGIPTSEPVANVAFSLFVAVLFVFFSDFFGIYVLADGSRTVVPFFSEAAIRSYWPGFVAVAAGTVLVSVWKLRHRKWTPPLAWTYIAIQLLSCAFFVFMFAEGSVFNPHFLEQLTQSGFASDPGAASRIWTFSTQWLAFLLAPFILVDVWQTLYKTYLK